MVLQQMKPFVKYRLVVEMQYRAGIAWIKFVGTHAQYDLINVETVNDY